MDKNKTKIVMILDKSGSMHSCKDDTEGGVNSYIEKQKKLDGEVDFTLVEFNSQYNTVYKNVPIDEVKPYTFHPSGTTALLDAVGSTIDSVGNELASLPEDERPGVVIVMIITDGEENTSREYKLARIKEMIIHQQEVYKWEFSFLGANQDAFAAGNSMGINHADIGNYNVSKTSYAFDAMSAKTGRVRAASMAGLDIKSVSAYTDEERAELES